LGDGFYFAFLNIIYEIGCFLPLPKEVALRDLYTLIFGYIISKEYG